MTKKELVHRTRMTALGAEFNSLLLACLRECASGRWGLFGQNELADPEDRFWTWPQAMRLREIALELQADGFQDEEIRSMCNKFLCLCDLRGPNIPGEPRLAAALLNEIEVA